MELTIPEYVTFALWLIVHSLCVMTVTLPMAYFALSRFGNSIQTKARNRRQAWLNKGVEA